jgi:GcrA cell cycle regulator
MGLQCLRVRLGKEYPDSRHSARLKGRRYSHWSIEMLWTAEAVEDLKRLALAGKSASRIAAELGGSRNAVIGKASRIGIKLNGGGGRPTSGAAPGRAGRPQWATARYAPPNADQGAHVVAAGGLSPREVRTPTWTFGEAEIGEMRRLRFEDIRESACRWPLGDPRSGEFAYCGLTPAKGQSYCAGHCRMAYRPPQARASTRERQGLRAIGNSWRVA